MNTYDWSRFVTRIPISASRQDVFEAWSSQAGLELWFLRSAEFVKKDLTPRPAKSRIEKGDTYKWHWHGYSDEVAETGTILEANGKNFLQFTFGKAGTVSIHIKEENSELLVELIQENIPVDDLSKANFHLGCSTGWTFYLANLKSILEGGLDLRNKNVNLTHVLNS